MGQMQKRGSDGAQCDKQPLEYNHQGEDEIIQAGVNDRENCLSSGHDNSVTSQFEKATAAPPVWQHLDPSVHWELSIRSPCYVHVCVFPRNREIVIPSGGRSLILTLARIILAKVLTGCGVLYPCLANVFSWRTLISDIQELNAKPYIHYSNQFTTFCRVVNSLFLSSLKTASTETHSLHLSDWLRQVEEVQKCYDG